MNHLLFLSTFVCIIATASSGLTKEKASEHSKKEAHRSHEAHVHGGGTLNIAFDGANGKAEFKAASEGILGFEHEAKSEKDKKALAKAVSQFEQDFGKFVSIDSTLGCEFTKELIGMQKDEDHDEDAAEDHKKKGEHSDFVANLNIKCSKPIKGSKLVVDFSAFKHLKDLDITVLADDVQKSAEYKGRAVSLELK